MQLYKHLRLCLNFFDCESFLESNSWHYCCIWHNLGCSFGSDNSSMRSYLPLIQKDSTAEIGPKTRFFWHFLKFGSLVFLEIEYNNSLQQCITPSRGDTHKKNLAVQIWAKTGQNQTQNQIFFSIFSSLVHQISIKLHRMIAWDNVQIVIEVKPAERNWGPEFGANRSKQGPNLGFLSFSNAWFISFPGNFLG